MYLLRYDFKTGSITGVWQGQDTAHLQAQAVGGEPSVGYLLTDSALSADALQQAWRVEAGTLAPKTELRLTASAPRFAADGVASCTVTVEPFVPCTLLIDTKAYVLTAEDPVLTITSLAPKAFVITLAPLGTHWAAAVLVEAV